MQSHILFTLALCSHLNLCYSSWVDLALLVHRWKKIQWEIGPTSLYLVGFQTHSSKSENHCWRWKWSTALSLYTKYSCFSNITILKGKNKSKQKKNQNQSLFGSFNFPLRRAECNRVGRYEFGIFSYFLKQSQFSLISGWFTDWKTTQMPLWASVRLRVHP